MSAPEVEGILVRLVTARSCSVCGRATVLYDLGLAKALCAGECARRARVDAWVREARDGV